MPQLPGKKVETLIILKSEWVKPPQGEGSINYRTTAYWQAEKLGAGIDTTTNTDKDYLLFNPYLTYKVNQAPVQLVGGYWTDSAGANFVHSGIWYADKWEKAVVFLEIREYIAVDGKSRDYLDNFLEIVYPVSKKTAIGFNLCYDRQWSGGDRNFIQAGPIAYYHISQNLTIFIRPTRETGSVDRVRFGLKFVF